MDKNYFPPRGLESRIIARIRTEELRLSRIKAWIFGLSAAAAFGILALLGKYAIDIMSQTGLSEYISLAFSFDGAVYAYWQELLLSIVESSPLLLITAFLGVAGFLIWSGANAVTNARRALLSA